MSTPERQPLADRVIEFSKKVDTYMIAAGSGIYILVSPAIGSAMIIGSVLTLIPATMAEKWLNKRRRGK